MARVLRVEYEGAIYHVTMRGNNRRDLFCDDADRGRFVTRLAERVDLYNIRLYLFCLMRSHAHLVLETPEANLSRFMHNLQTAYVNYFNLRHEQSGHLTEHRFGARLVQGDEYILKLSRYVHLNPVFTERLKHLALKERRKILRKYRWSSYRSYAGLVKELEFVDYGPVVAMMAGRRRAEKRREYRRFVEAGIARTDQEFADCLKASRLAIGSEAFCNWVRDRHFDLVMGQKRKEDASFRRTGHPLRAEEIETVVCRELRVDVKVLQEQRRDSFVRPVAARMLVKYGGLTQREVADRLGVTSGAAVSHQMKRLSGGLAADPELHRRVTRIESVLGQKKKQSASALER